ncbi:pEARLI1-like lipid transfer protein 1 [Panicum miliaceum]|uniref:PEARLI1-like lipid transfer protein 1 n=1 Tax=Panicum miliaceum TaxID=4540 RepID=A0A3L6Q9H8_PANMI|nr:pEARLI1-like lipid transfer protein 1 [Panicum miliaceum]
MAASSKVVMSLLVALLAALSMAAAQAPPPPPPPAVPAPPPAAAAGNGTCPTNALNLRVCANLLNGLVRTSLGLGPLVPGVGDQQCCPLIGGLVGLDAAACLCAAIRNNTIPGIINFYVPLGLGLLLNHCGNTTVPAGVSCPPAAA